MFWTIVGVIGILILFTVAIYIRSSANRVKSFDSEYHEQLKQFEAKKKEI